MENKFFTVKDLADILKVSEKTIYRLIESKEIQAFKIGQSWRIKESDLQKFLEDRSNK